jgi:hypothetical protein
MTMTAKLPAQTSTALKEWATVLEAMSRGEQLVMIRKGGLIEPGQGFELVAETFVFYPTFEHQAVSYLRPQFQAYFAEAASRRAPSGQVTFELVGVAVSSWRSADVSVIERLKDAHIYNDAFATQRLKWQPEQPLVITAVRAFRLPQPLTVAALPQYAGCKSWVNLESAIPLSGATPVMSDAEFEKRLREVKNGLRGFVQG